MEEVLREIGFPKDIAQYICRTVQTMYLNEWRARMIVVHETLDCAMYCVKWSVEQIIRRGAPSISGCSWTGYSLTRYPQGLEVHA